MWNIGKSNKLHWPVKVWPKLHQFAPSSVLLKPETTFPLLSEQNCRSPLSVRGWKLICSRSTSLRHHVPLQSSTPFQLPPPLPPLIHPEVKLKIFPSSVPVLFGFHFNSFSNIDFDCWPLRSHWNQTFIMHQSALRLTTPRMLLYLRNFKVQLRDRYKNPLQSWFRVWVKRGFIQVWRKFKSITL